MFFIFKKKAHHVPGVQHANGNGIPIHNGNVLQDALLNTRPDLMQPIARTAEGSLSHHHMGSGHSATTARAMTDAADNVGLSDDAGHLSAVVTDDDQIVTRTILRNAASKGK